MRVLSVCSGIGADVVAWAPLGWTHVGFSEIATAPCAVLAHHWPAVPNLGDLRHVAQAPPRAAFDLLIGGTPCQDFSIAGGRKGLGGQRSGLAWDFLRLAERKRPRWVVWENVPGALLTNSGRDFDAFTRALGERGYGLAWRILDAQHFGVPQRRRRIFVVGRLGADWRGPAAVLFERGGLFGDPLAGSPPRPDLALVAGGGLAGPSITDTMTQGCELALDGQNLVIVFDGTQITSPHNRSNPKPGDPCHTITVKSGPPLAFDGRQDPTWDFVAPTMARDCGSYGVLEHGLVRRLMPVECERLQGFHDGHTLVPHTHGKPMADTPRYACLGNSIAVDVLAWLGRRIAMVDGLMAERGHLRGAA